MGECSVHEVCVVQLCKRACMVTFAGRLQQCERMLDGACRVVRPVLGVPSRSLCLQGVQRKVRTAVAWGRRPEAKSVEFFLWTPLGTPVLRYKLFVLFIIKADRSALNILAPFGSRTP